MNNLKYILFVFLLFSRLSSSANEYWKKEYAQADKIALSVKKTSDLRLLSHNLTSSLPDKVDKYRAIFTWIAHNITYDCREFKKTKSKEISGEDVVVSGKSICQGYANLFKELCKYAGIECFVISGYARNSFSAIGKPFPTRSNHAWNAIKINNKYYLCDVTWAAGYVDENCTKFIKQFNDFYFCTPPEVFSLNHYPFDNKWFQILGHSKTKAEFVSQPHYFSNAIKYNINLIQPTKGYITFEKGKEINFEFTTDIKPENIIVQLSNSGKGEMIDFEQVGNKISFKFVLTKYSPYLNVFINMEGAIVFKLIN